MNLAEDRCLNMIEIFQTADLQELLTSFNVTTSGNYAELKEQVLSFLRNNSIGLNNQAYRGKIVEIYNRRQRQRMETMSMEQARPTRPPPPPYHNHLTRISQVGSSYVMPLFQTGIYKNNNSKINNIQYNNLPTVPPNIVPQVSHPNQSWHTTTPNTVATDGPSFYNLNHENAINPSTPHLAYVKLNKLPFYKAKTEVIKPTTLIGHYQCTLLNNSQGMREKELTFTLTPEQATIIGMNRDISNGKNEYVYQLLIRICLYKPGRLEVIDHLPTGLHIRINNKVCPLPSAIHKSQSNIETRRIAPPIDCTGLVKLNPSVTNKVIINWIPDVNNYVVAMYLVEKLTPENLLQKLIDKGPTSSEETKNFIRQKLSVLDSDMSTVSYRVSLMCPLGKKRVQIPAKSTKCDHIQCFDARTFILMNEKKPTWMCPTCSQPCLFEDVRIQSYFSEIVSSPNLSDNCKEIELFGDGTWKLFDEHKEPVEIDDDDVEGKLIDSITLDDSGNENRMEAKEEHNHNPEIQKESGNIKSIVDLTLSGDEESKAADVVPQITIASYYCQFNPLVQEQSQLEVTSSGQRAVIEVDSNPSLSTSATSTTTTF